MLQQVSNRSRWSLALLLTYLAVAAGKLAIASTTLVATDGFESFARESIVDQFGWKTAGTGTSTAVVQNEVVVTGDQAVEVNRTAGSDRRWAVPNSGLQTGRFVTISWDMAVNVTEKPGVLGPVFGVEAYDAFENFGVLGMLGVDGTTGEVLRQLPESGYLMPTGFLAATGVWNHFEIVLDFQTDKYMSFFNGDPLGSLAFVDGDFGLDHFTDANIATFAGSDDGTSINEPGTAWFDNFIVYDGLPGDYNGDNRVDAADYTVWRDHLGSVGSTGAPSGDGNGDLVVDELDYFLWRSNFGRSPESFAAVSVTGTVPEPSTVVVGFCCVLAIGLKLIHRRN